MDENIRRWTDECQRILKNPKWFPWEFIKGQQGLICIGAECPLITRGPRKGEPDYRHYDKETKDMVVLVRKDPSVAGCPDA